MNSVRSYFGILALSAGLGGLGCSHEQKAPPAHPAPPPVATRVTPPPQPVAEAPSEAPKDKEEPAIFFDFDSYTLRADAHPVLQKMAASIKSARVTELEIDGNCDELGTTEYNMALGEERARAAKNYLVHLGVPNARVRTVSYGSERPKYPGHDDGAHAKNRRDDLVVR
ncbi:MAG TPA: OmpA family protein [Polyangia bacterium]|nr:OmpA family protein [Polyangia bacterium]